MTKKKRRKGLDERFVKTRSVLEEDAILYWAYGSNLNVDAMRSRCPKAKPYKPLYINDGQLVFRGVADVEAVDERSSVVAGGLWMVTPECVAVLDRYEGVANSFYDKRYLMLEINGKVKPALFYKMNEAENGIHPPWGSYVEIIAKGYRDFGLDHALLEEALERSWGSINKTPNLLRRWINKGRPALARALNGTKAVTYGPWPILKTES
jgi:gamma-glutamylcyclotransferase (GGCT)/AIG2-like uncharacterized protein YtfP